jgi:hypothetical protein
MAADEWLRGALGRALGAFAPGAAAAIHSAHPVAPARAEGADLVALLAPAVPLADADGSEVLLLAVELWTTVVIMRLGSAGGGPGTTLLMLPLRLADDVSTTYTTVRGTASVDPPLRAERVFTPAVPAAARQLVVSVPAAGGRQGGAVELELPERGSRR